MPFKFNRFASGVARYLACNALSKVEKSSTTLNIEYAAPLPSFTTAIKLFTNDKM